MKGESETQRRARYAARDVTDKLGIRPAQRVHVVGAGDPALLKRVRERVGRRLVGGGMRADVVLYWPRSAEEVTATLAALKAHIEPSGGIWVISPKRGHEARSHAAYLPDATLIPSGLAAGLVDNKICSVSEHESGMRFVIRRAERNSQEGP